MFKPIIGEDNILKFMLAGKAVFTVMNAGSGNRFTYKVIKDKIKPIHYVFVMYGYLKFAYIGLILQDKKFLISKKSKVGENATCFKGFKYILEKLRLKSFPDNYKFFHLGYCGRCGREITRPDSISNGFGSECIKYANGWEKLSQVKTAINFQYY